MRHGEVRGPDDVGVRHDALWAHLTGVCDVVHGQRVVLVLRIEMLHVDLPECVTDDTFFTNVVLVGEIWARDATCIGIGLARDRVRVRGRRRERARRRDRVRRDRQRVVVLADNPGDRVVRQHARGNLEAAAVAPLFAPRVLPLEEILPVLLPPADGVHGVIRAVRTGAIQAEDAAGVAHKRVVGVYAEGHGPALVHGGLQVLEILRCRLQHEQVLAHARRFEIVLEHRLGERPHALARAWRSGAGLVEVLRAGPESEVRAARRRRDAGVLLDVLVYEILPTSHAAVVALGGARSREAAGQRRELPVEM
mmetsp:Transcript_57703/g.175738  ORF Transcript_57703/g.175738 Transcript_57703/m.175738 type:complete len:309 (-) Transcript_57703:803-1729(-)